MADLSLGLAQLAATMMLTATVWAGLDGLGFDAKLC
jgi:hypothetical protein